MKGQLDFTDVEYSQRETKPEGFLECMDAAMPWDEVVVMIKPHYEYIFCFISSNKSMELYLES